MVEESTARWWEEQSKSSLVHQDEVLFVFDLETTECVAEGKPAKFTLDKVIDLQDRLEGKKPNAKDNPELERLLAIFAPGATKSLAARGHKLTKICSDRLNYLAANPSAMPTAAPAPAPAEPPTLVPAPAVQQHQPSPATTDDSPLRVFPAPQEWGLAPGLPEGATIVIRTQPSTDGRELGKISSSSPVSVVGMKGIWAKLLTDDPTTDSWALTQTPDNMALLAVVHENENTSYLNPAHDRSSPERKPFVQQQHERAYTSPGASIGEFVSYQEHAELKSRVAQLEQELSSLRSLLRRA